MRTIARTLFSFRGRLSLGGFWAGAIGAAIVIVAAFTVTAEVGGRAAQYLVHPFALWWIAAFAAILATIGWATAPHIHLVFPHGTMA